MAEASSTRLGLPRPLINQLLHAAQAMPDKAHWGVISASDNQPVRCYRLEPDDDAGLTRLRHKLAARNETPFAWYRADPGTASIPDLAELGKLDLSVHLLFSVSLGTKGVLQLRGWRVDGKKLSELEIGLSEEA
ncbi:MAG TPA: hypothetical protein VFL15_05750 [Gammaproteobacteria bacterium]|nr:hypothetical protein [Gammaproteobacteria bacterium]